VRRRGLPLGHELCGSLPVISLRSEKSPAAPGSGLHAPGFQAARNHAPDRRETLHLHRQLHHASAAPGNHPYLKEPSTSSPALLSPASCCLAAYLPLSPPLLFLPFLHLPLHSPTNLLTSLPLVGVMSVGGGLSILGTHSVPAVGSSFVTSRL